MSFSNELVRLNNSPAIAGHQPGLGIDFLLIGTAVISKANGPVLVSSFPPKTFLPVFIYPSCSLCVQISSILPRPRQYWLQWHPDKAQRRCWFATWANTHATHSSRLLWDCFFGAVVSTDLTRCDPFPHLHTPAHRFRIRWWEAGEPFHSVSSLITSPNTHVPPLLGSPLWMLQLALLSFVRVPNAAV